MEKLMFKEICFSNLIKGTKYIIKRINKPEYIRMIYIGKFSDYIYRYDSVSMFVDVKELRKPELECCKMNFTYEYDTIYYIIVKQKEKIQQAMELRATNQVLRSIIGDETFVYK